ncbi:alpha-hydroxy acid oxidase [Tatumella sp. UBA2305]|uniref:alpha-hydroxy acid oxidase n=1 Tax=Tatumella sp. UBA2305 TaxID=1947647 RepID=UPI0025DCA623|nr:alpha-hydroxy acid oxidase [Tatumella sp. UBA2305]
MILNTDDLRNEAKRVLPGFVFDYVDGGAGDEKTLQINRRTFDQWLFAPSVLRDASQRDLSVTLGRSRLSAPLLVAPTGYNGMLRHNADLMLAQAAAQAGIGYIQSTVSTAPIESVAEASSGDRWFQLYVLKDRQVTRDLIERATHAGCSALVVSVDAVHFGNRERDKRYYRRPMKLSYRAMAGVALKPRWFCTTLLPAGMPGFGNLLPYLPPQYRKGAGGAGYFASQMDTKLDWETLKWIRSLWQGDLYIKGLMTPQDALLAKSIGASGIVISNHGGRQLDGTLSPLTVLPEIRRQTGPDFTLLIDSGFRRGTDIVKALALGADAVLLGRPLLYALAVGGRAQLDRTLNALIDETSLTLAQLGCTTLRELGPELLYTPTGQSAAR